MGKYYNKIVLDIDNTITRLQPTLDMMGRVFRRVPVFEEDVVEFRLSNSYKVSRKKELDFWHTYEEDICIASQVATERLFAILENYTTKDTKIYVITSRGDKYHDQTYDWLVRNRIPFNQLFCLGKISKTDLIEEVKAEAVFEDNPDFFYELWDAGLFPSVDTYCIDYAYNQHVPAKFRLDRDTGEEIPVGNVMSDTLDFYTY